MEAHISQEWGTGFRKMWVLFLGMKLVWHPLSEPEMDRLELLLLLLLLLVSHPSPTYLPPSPGWENGRFKENPLRKLVATASFSPEMQHHHLNLLLFPSPPHIVTARPPLNPHFHFIYSLFLCDLPPNWLRQQWGDQILKPCAINQDFQPEQPHQPFPLPNPLHTTSKNTELLCS